MAWFMLTSGWYSATIPKRDNGALDPSRIQIRARCHAHMESLIAEIPVLHDLNPPILKNVGTDYAYRIYVSKEQFAIVMAQVALSVTYVNFKGAAERRYGHDSSYVHALHEVWGIGMKLQLEDLKTPRKKPMSNLPRNKKPGILVEDSTVVGGTDATTGATVIRPKTTDGRADESTKATDNREQAKQ